MSEACASTRTAHCCGKAKIAPHIRLYLARAIGNPPDLSTWRRAMLPPPRPAPLCCDCRPCCAARRLRRSGRRGWMHPVGGGRSRGSKPSKRPCCVRQRSPRDQACASYRMQVSGPFWPNLPQSWQCPVLNRPTSGQLGASQGFERGLTENARPAERRGQQRPPALHASGRGRACAAGASARRPSAHMQAVGLCAPRALARVRAGSARACGGRSHLGRRAARACAATFKQDLSGAFKPTPVCKLHATRA